LEQYPTAEFSMAIIIIATLLLIFYLVIKSEFFQKCPRCSTWGISPNGFLGTHSNCRKCGMFLHLSCNEPQKDSRNPTHQSTPDDERL
jgi:hypothetical protein